MLKTDTEYRVVHPFEVIVPYMDEHMNMKTKAFMLHEDIDVEYIHTKEDVIFLKTGIFCGVVSVLKEHFDEEWLTEREDT